ncbi:MAG: hypothetical protein HC904_14610 [Blastochloris sp.]|nr:hypothetical protein [Blastochloris sp.]
MSVMNRMPMISIVTGILLDIAGIFSFVSTGSQYMTALIPCVFGILIFIAGVVATKAAWLKHAMHGAAVVALLGLLAGGGRMIQTLVTGTVTFDKVVATGSLALICGAYLAFCVMAFIEARTARMSGHP